MVGGSVGVLVGVAVGVFVGVDVGVTVGVLLGTLNQFRLLPESVELVGWIVSGSRFVPSLTSR